jgi:AcrR family transcriptional regulator
MVDLCAERSYERVDVEDLLERSGLSAAEFNRQFVDKEDCAMEVLEAFVEDFETRIRSVFENHEEWRTALRATAYECAAGPRSTRTSSASERWRSWRPRAR